MHIKNLLNCFLVTMVVTMLFQCKESDTHVHNGRIPLVAVDDHILYKDEVDLLYAVYGNGMDSVAFYDDYVERWAIDVLFYRKATENVASTDEIEEMVSSYRKSLILSVYQDGLINQHLVPDIKHEEVQEFYENNAALFELEEPLVKGLLLKVPEKSPKMNNVRKWCMQRTVEDLENIEKYSIANAATYECFIDEWVPLDMVASRTPLTVYQLGERLSRKNTIEFADGGYVYFIGADTIISKGKQKPLELVSAEIVELLVNSKKANFIKEKKRALYYEAQSKGEIVRMDKQTEPVQ